MSASRVSVVHVAEGPTGWEVSHRGQVLYWGRSLDRAVREARRHADVLAPARIVVDGPGPDASGSTPTWGAFG